MGAELLHLAGEITAAHEAACHAAGAALDHARQAGDLLTQVKAALPHGDWLAWLAEHCPAVSPQTAQRYMRIAARWPEIEAANASRGTYLPVRQALALLASPRGASDATESDDDQTASAMLAELSVLEKALEAPDLTAAELSAIVRRAEDLEGIGHAMKIRALSAMGDGIARVRAACGDEVADAFAAIDPRIMRQAAEARIQALQGETDTEAPHPWDRLAAVMNPLCDEADVDEAALVQLQARATAADVPMPRRKAERMALAEAMGADLAEATALRDRAHARRARAERATLALLSEAAANGWTWARDLLHADGDTLASFLDFAEAALTEAQRHEATTV